ncbi:hypothetical protein [Zobellia nedashkovskayae]|uniref:hypothetical protein n=1 Tax=Zobellia nedashkovskayae TaxID=2779510 RepID=UPI00188C0B60|nr:hypothetical protein [Zobellia nedashkovskayae]
MCFLIVNQLKKKNYLAASGGSQTGENLSNFTKPVTDLSPNISGLMTDLLGGSFIGAGGNVLGEEIKLKLEIEKND